MQQLGIWLQAGKRSHPETIVRGFSQIPQAFLDLFEGKVTSWGCCQTTQPSINVDTRVCTQPSRVRGCDRGQPLQENPHRVPHGGKEDRVATADGIEAKALTHVLNHPSALGATEREASASKPTTTANGGMAVKELAVFI
jgi:hypothetical protein